MSQYFIQGNLLIQMPTHGYPIAAYPYQTVTHHSFIIYQYEELTMINDMEFSYTDYGGDLGVFIESINSVGNDTEGNKWWQYWVNDKHAEIGVSSYLVQPEDVVEFKFIESQF